MRGPRFNIASSDAVGWLSGLPTGSVDLVITDPPYESLEKHRAIGTTTRLKQSKSSSNDWFGIFPNSRFEELFREVWRVLARNSHFYLYCDPETMFVAKPMAESVGFKFWKPLIWDKKKIGMGYHYRARYECILFFEKGKRRLKDLGAADIIECPRIYNGYPAEKPAEVSSLLVRQSSEADATICDPFVGSGSVGVASVSQGRNFIGCDIAPSAVNLAVDRLVLAGATFDPGLCSLLGPFGRDSSAHMNRRMIATAPTEFAAAADEAAVACREVRPRSDLDPKGIP